MLKLFSLTLLMLASNVLAKTIVVTSDQNLQSILSQAVSGDLVQLTEGTYKGNFVITQSITLKASDKNSAPVIVDAQGKGSALTLEHSNITISGLTIKNWGDDLTEQNAGIYSEKKSTNITLNNNNLAGDGFGIWLQKSQQVKIHHNKIRGNLNLRSADRGNGIQLSSVQHAHVYNNDVAKVRDGIYIIASQHNLIEQNTMHQLRYGIHYMYSHDNKVKNNSAYNTRAGYALMSSRRLEISGNKTRDSEDYGFLLNFITASTFTNNIVQNVWTKPENKVMGREGKGLFVYNSGYNTISGNLIDTAEIGIHLTAGSEKTKVYGNSFINNPIQVKYVVNREEEWSKDGKGNFWSNYLGWDLDNNGSGDTPFEPNDSIDKIIWQYPEAKVLLDSPAILLLRFVQKQFPVLKPTGVKDSFPLIQQPQRYQPEVKVIL
ncbi:nitrous oxide reductase family maturation protein NosD [Pseudoalteromonas denitrificans]|uniref:Nitrous oxidase accessory protein n=1 Tax=Pseudoalteromonas denitrificans DSM 6059 TaxID=1123010 RepID=A0A1I1G3N2_9GAMM|nr:nitrous oxide reductase family maturation protein NosD [Pseudoalteromonas denitrificans]SFC06194.1 nitrous oxidase accessory protein [Pseudoalteromonas denitrificans DSM 6059]